MHIKVNNKTYNIKVAETEEEKRSGLLNVKELPQDGGMLFIYDYPQTVSFYMKDTIIPLDIIFINEELEVISVVKGKPYDETLLTEDNVMYVLELNVNSGVKRGDDVEFEDDEGPVMKVLAPDGSVQMELWSGERIFRRSFTKRLIDKIKQAESVKNDKLAYDAICKKVGRMMFKEIHRQDNQLPEYVNAPSSN